MSSGYIPPILSVADQITFDPSGTIAATDVQAAIEEVSGDVTTLAGVLVPYSGATGDVDLNTNDLLNAHRIAVGSASSFSPLKVIGTAVNGLQILIGSNETNHTNKAFGFCGQHQDTSEENVGLLVGNSTYDEWGTNYTRLYWGGGSANVNAAMYHGFYAAANDNTTTGTMIMQMSIAGVVLPDNIPIMFGNGSASDSYISFDGTDLTVYSAGLVNFTNTIQAGSYQSSDGSAGIDTTFVDNDGNTITVKDGLITAKTAP